MQNMMSQVARFADEQQKRRIRQTCDNRMNIQDAGPRNLGFELLLNLFLMRFLHRTRPNAIDIFRLSEANPKRFSVHRHLERRFKLISD